jgi:hypothetical protein
VRWGIGRYLYDLSSPWVVIEAFGKSFKIADTELPKLAGLLKAHFIADCESHIRLALDAVELRAWWSAGSADRRTFALDSTEATKLKDAVIARIAELDPKKAAA